MAKQTKLSVRIDPELKEVLDAYVRRSHIPQQSVVQMALAAWLEEAEALELIEERRQTGEYHSLEEAKSLLEL